MSLKIRNGGSGYPDPPFYFAKCKLRILDGNSNFHRAAQIPLK